MPTYVYGCDACGQQFEKFQKFSDQPVRECPNCGHTVRRIIQPAGIVFKGSGWHVTDYKRGGKGANSDATAAETSTNGDTAPAQTDAKPDAAPAKSDTKPNSKNNTASEAAA